MQHKLQTGFTAIELMVTLAVAVTLAVLAVPTFRDLIDKSRLRGATDDIVNLLNTSRANAIKLQRDVNVSINTAGWCAGAASAPDQTNVGDPTPAAAACDCTATTVTCTVGNENATTNQANQTSVVSSSNYSGVTLSNVANAVLYGNGGVTFNSKFGGIDLASAPSTATAVVTVNSSTGKYSTQIYLYPLGQVYACVPSSSPFVAGYPSC